MTLSLAERSQYTPDGQMAWSRLPLLALPIVTALLTGLLLAWLFHAGWYLLFLTALLAAGIVCCSTWLTVHLLRCRIPKLAAFIGLLAGSVAYLSYFYFDMVAQFGPNAIARVDMVPEYIHLRMQNDVQEDVGGGLPNRKARKPNVMMNWFTFGYEALMIVGCAVEVARRAAWRAWDPKLNCWMKREDVRINAGGQVALTDALQNERLDDFLRRFRPVAMAGQTTVCSLTLEYTDHGTTSPLERPVYLSAVETSIRTAFRSLFSRKGLFLQVQLTAQEALRLQPLFPKFSASVCDRHEELAAVSHAPGYSTADAEAWSAATASISEIPESEQVRIFAGRHLLLQNLCGFMPLAILAAGALLGFLATLVPSLIGSILIGIPAAAMIIVGILIAICCPHAAETTYASSVLRRKLMERSGCAVDWKSPDLFHVALTERENWQRLKLETASDAGFAEFDGSEKLGMECDAERFEIPFASIVSVSTENFMMPIDQRTEFWYTTLVVKIPNGTREIILCDATPVWGFWTNKRRRMRAEEISQRITELSNTET